MDERLVKWLAAMWLISSLAFWVVEERGEPLPCRFTRLRCRPTSVCELRVEWPSWWAGHSTRGLVACEQRTALPRGHPPVRRSGASELCSAAIAAAAAAADGTGAGWSWMAIVVALALLACAERPRQAKELSATELQLWLAQHTSRPTAEPPAGWHAFGHQSAAQEEDRPEAETGADRGRARQWDRPPVKRQ